MASFISVEDLGLFLRKDMTDDDLAVIAVDAASELVRSHCDRTFDAVVGATAILDGTGTQWLLLPELPVTALTSVTLYDGTASETLLVEGLDEDYVWDAAGRVYRNVYNWPTEPQSITVVYSHGYATVPSDVRLVALNAAGRLYDHAGIAQETVGSYNVNYTTGEVSLTAAEKLVLAKHKKGRAK